MADTELSLIETAVMDVVLSREGKRRYSNGDPLTLDPSDLRDIVRLTMAKCAALASRPAEVDDEGLPPLPVAQMHVKVWYSTKEDGESLQNPTIAYYTAEQFRQGQRDAVAADRARRGLVEEPFYPQLFLNWNRSQEVPPVSIGKEMYVAQKAVELSKSAPSHTTNKEKGGADGHVLDR